ncbi:hypothetical protein NKI51_29045 [Mesorhizobium australicum]|uniref:hypothetical protein n=1 Tax=Mesorhizobium australicum TaxID=536018 RepID=UPI00333D149A
MSLSTDAARVLPAAAAKRREIERVLGMISEDEYATLERRCYELFGLHYHTATEHKYSIKCIIERRRFSFVEGLSNASKAFMILHTIGHYYFITNAVRKGVRRYEHIYDTFENANLHVYDTIFNDHDSIEHRKRAEYEFGTVPEKIRIDRTVFEVGANNYAIHVLQFLKMEHLGALVRIYEPADLIYILDVTAGGRHAIVESDHDYLDRYVCNNPTIKDEPDIEGVYEPGKFHINNIDWQSLEDIKLEIHFF